jgi:hypothetical protein
VYCATRRGEERGIGTEGCRVPEISDCDATISGFAEAVSCDDASLARCSTDRIVKLSEKVSGEK